MARATDGIVVAGGRRVHLRNRVGGGPPVLLMAGCGMSMYYWADVARRMPGSWLAAFDRPGLGGTRWPGHLPSLAQEVATLQQVVHELGRPAILVAHSMAALHAEALLLQHPESVAGLVLVDPSIEWPSKRYSSSPGAWHVRAMLRGLELLPLGALTTRVQQMGAWSQSSRGISRMARDGLASVYRDPQAIAMAVAESFAFGQQAWDLQVMREQRPLRPVPTVLLTAAASSESGISNGSRLAGLLRGGHVVVDDCKHMMMIDQPAVVARVVAEVARRSQPGLAPSR